VEKSLANGKVSDEQCGFFKLSECTARKFGICKDRQKKRKRGRREEIYTPFLLKIMLR